MSKPLTLSIHTGNQGKLAGRGMAAAFTLMLILSFSLGLAACANQPAKISAELGQEFILEPGQNAILANEALEIHFIKVASDSRCPKGAQCIWAGQAASQVEITYQGEKYDLILTQMGGSDAEYTFVNYKIIFDVQPYPELNKTIEDKDYRLHLVVTQ